jgi:glucose-1-phosphate cytidylyltransferase
MDNSINEFYQVPVAILCGGNGVMLNEKQNQRTNKGLVEVYNKPLFWWVMQHYALHGATEFILATGFQSELFLFALENIGAKKSPTIQGCYDVIIAKKVCRVHIVTTMPNLNTAERLFACKSLLDKAARFAVSYSDTLSDLDLSSEMRFHKNHKVVATLASIKFPMRFRVLGVRAGEFLVRGFTSRPVIESANVNGGYYIFTNELWKTFLCSEKSMALESFVLESLVASKQLTAFEHFGLWQNCDAERDLSELTRIASYLDSLNR